MAISLETLVARDSSPEQANITEEEAKGILQKEINYVIEEGKKSSHGHWVPCFFELTSSPLTHIGGRLGRVLERQKVQDIFLKLAEEEYGMNSEVSEEKTYKHEAFNSSTEYRDYPARDGLYFRRMVHFRGDGKPTSVTWGALWRPTT